MIKRAFFCLLSMISTLAFSLSDSPSEFRLPESLAHNYVQNLNGCDKGINTCNFGGSLIVGQAKVQTQDPEAIAPYLNQGEHQSVFIPLSLNDQELLTLAAAASLGVVAFNEDQKLMNFVQNHKSPATQNIARTGNFLGSGALLPVAAGTYFLGVYLKDGKLKRAGIITVGAAMATTLVTVAVKHIAGRSRPEVGKGPYSFGNNGEQSFYSGHTAIAFSIATVVSEMYKDEYPAIPWIAYGLSAVTAYARMHDKKHWTSDVVVGAAAGHLITKLFLSAMGEDEESRAGVFITPVLDPVTGSFHLDFQYAPKGW